MCRRLTDAEMAQYDKDRRREREAYNHSLILNAYGPNSDKWLAHIKLHRLNAEAGDWRDDMRLSRREDY